MMFSPSPKDIPIIFSATMILALLDGRKTMTRRLAWRSVPLEGDELGAAMNDAPGAESWSKEIAATWQRVKPGDRLWCRESLQKFSGSKGTPSAQYVADISPVQAHRDDARLIDGRAIWNWSKDKLPSIHMPRWASRLTLIVTATKIERVQEITNEDAEAEGVKCDMSIRSFKEHFKILWCDLHGYDSWDANPEVVAISFSVHKANIDTLPKSEAA